MEEQSYEEFRKGVLKLTGKRNIIIRNCWGVYDAYKHIRKNNWYDIGRPLKEHEFYSIIRTVNNHLAEELALGHSVTFPSRMGHLELRKFSTGASMEDGKLKVTYPINWKDTLKLWYEDPEAKEQKTLVRHPWNSVFYIKYCKHKANYNNQSYYQFKLNRSVEEGLRGNINKGLVVDTLYE